MMATAEGDVIEVPGKDGQPPYKVGVIKLPSFYADNQALQAGDENAKSASHDVRKILEDFKAKGVQGVVMDLRNNGGGLLNEAIELTGLFIDEGPVVQVRDFSGRVFPYKDDFPGVAYDGPLVVLISKFSASASEIFAGAIKDYGRGLVVGDSSTHGKGTVQKVLDLDRDIRGGFGGGGGKGLGAVKLTMQQFYRVNGQSTQNMGVPSDIVLPSPSDHEDFGEAKLDYALDSDQIPNAMYLPMGNVNKSLIAELQKLSSDRFASDPELQKLKTKKDKIHERRNRGTLVFNETSMKKDREEFKDENEDADELHEDGATSKDGKKKEEKKFGTDPYTNEVLRITSDYIRLGDEHGLTANK
ncbi:MAG: carboxy terminal-processing peptidase [Planctomycetota bacterium]